MEGGGCQKLGELLTEFKIPNIPVQKAVEEKALPPTWINELQGFSAQVGQKAFELFEKYGQPAGRQMEHWFEAEKQLLCVPRSQLLDTAGEYQARVALPGFDANEIEVTALPDSLLVKAEASQKREKLEGDVRFSEFSDQSLFRRIRLSELIDIAQVTAKLDKGVLKIVAQKAAANTAKNISVAAA